MPTALAIIGCGVIGQRRAENLPPDTVVVGCYDPNPSQTRALSQKTGAPVCESLEQLLALKPRAAIIASVNSTLTELAGKCLNSGVSVLVEKPAARSFEELSKVSVPKDLVFKVGFNHRFHPAYRDLLAELKSQPADPIMYVRARYGNGARVGFEKEWRADPAIAGGGELLDQGVHVIDLAQQLMGPLTVQQAWVRTHYWDMAVDDNAWALATGPQGQTFQFHVSSTEWKNEFSFEAYTRRRKYHWSGLGRSYGAETLTIFKMKPEMGPPDVERRDYPADDRSWFEENTNFISAVEGKTQAWGTVTDALASLRVVRDIYSLSAKAQARMPWPHPKSWNAV